jgi:23S rRNA pseudouridine2605 synthase
MRNERGPKKTGRTGSASYKGKSTSSSSDRKTGSYKKTTSPRKYTKSSDSDTGKDFKKTAGPRKYTKSTSDTGRDFKKQTGPKKYGTGFKKDGDKWEDRKEKPTSARGPYKKRTGTDRDSTEKPGRKPYAKKSFGDNDFSKEKKSFGAKTTFKKKYGDRDATEKPDRTSSFEKKPFDAKKTTKKSGSYADYKKKGAGSNFEERKEYKRKTGIKTYTDKNDPDRIYTKETEVVRNKNASKSFKKVKVYQKEEKEGDGLVRLNKFIANAGICSRREADTYIQTGVVTVNGVIITELGYKVKPEDRVLFHDKPIMGEKLVYILLNKPKDYITTSKDPQNRKTVLELVNGVKERIFPIGRLDRNTTGVLLLTNDGVLAEKLMHPRKGVSKIYHVELDKRFSAPDMEQIRNGIELEDGFFKPDEVDYAEGMDKHHVGIEIHSGANRIVRRLFESLKYDVIKLDRVVYAGLTKKGLTRGKWRFLKDSELHALKMM